MVGDMCSLSLYYCFRSLLYITTRDFTHRCSQTPTTRLERRSLQLDVVSTPRTRLAVRATHPRPKQKVAVGRATYAVELADAVVEDSKD